MRKVLVRADASTEIGYGHVMRCLALAQALKEIGAEVAFASEVPDALRARLESEGCEVIQPGDSADIAALAKAEGAEWVVLDGYRFTADDQRKLKSAGLKVLAIDDYGQAEHYYADLVLNQNIYAREALYPSLEPTTRLLLGAKYAMLRKEFWPHRNSYRRIAPVVEKVLVSFGGGDPHNMSTMAVEALEGVSPEPAIRVIVGSANPHKAALRKALEKFEDAQLLEGISDMAEHYIWADMAILGAGSATWEALYLGLPSILVAFAENQRPVGEEADREGYAVYGGWYEDIDAGTLLLDAQNLAADPDKRRALAGAGQQTIDAHGAQRVAHEMLEESLYIRVINQRDMRTLWEWKNDPLTRGGSFNPDEIPWETHVAWFTKRLTDDDTRICIGEDRGVIVGQSRHRRAEGTRNADSDLIIAPDQRGKGYAFPVFMGATDLCFRTGFCDMIFAHIKSENLGSIKPYVKSPYRITRTLMMHDAEVTEFELTKDEYLAWIAAGAPIGTGERQT